MKSLEPFSLWDDIEGAIPATKSSPIMNYKKSSYGLPALLLCLFIFFLGKEGCILAYYPANITSQVTEQTIQESTTNQIQNNTITQPLDEKKER